MKPTSINVIVTALSPLSHGDLGPKIGNAIAFRRMELAGVPTPVISGNSLCGTIRRILWREIFNRCNLSRETLEAKAWDRLYGALANGGTLEKSEVSTDPDRQRSLRVGLPPLSALGSALYSFMLSGNASFPFLIPEIPEGMDPEDLIEDISLARHVDRGEQDPGNSGVTPMPVEIETVKTGTVFRGEILWLANPHTRAEVGSIVWALDHLEHLGGKAHTGFGRVHVEHDGSASARQSFETWLEDPATGGILTNLASDIS